MHYELATLTLPFGTAGAAATNIRAFAAAPEAQGELLLGYWWQLAATTALMATFVTAFALLTDALRDALDPRLRGL